MTLGEFYAAVQAERAVHHNQRMGQILFNILCILRPDISETIRATPNDPFYADSVHDPRYMAAVKVIEMMWEDQ